MKYLVLERTLLLECLFNKFNIEISICFDL